MQKNILAVHDISCVGKCSLTVALPILSASGAVTSVLPTTVLSTHTGFDGVVRRELTDEMLPSIHQWENIGINFDAVYTGYLGSIYQVELVSALFDSSVCKNSKIFVDPVMADHGKLYKSFTNDYVSAITILCKKADTIMPNITEACLMLGKEFRTEYNRTYIEDLLRGLAELGAKKALLTGVSFDPDSLGAAAIDCESGEISYHFADRIEGRYHGTGDIFGSSFVGAVICGKNLDRSLKIAVNYTSGCIKRTHDAGTELRFGVNFEDGLADYIAELKK